jgi:lipid II isoglutaminyl synthase (glutamine-hydrolysing)
MAGRVSRAIGLGAGVAITGRVIDALAPHSLAELSLGRKICVVSGTNGKTTTTRFIADGLRTCNLGVGSNDSGANLRSGVVATLAGSQESDWIVLELDEGFLPLLVPLLQPQLAVLTNLTRDQLDRFWEVGLVAKIWHECLSGHPYMQVVANSRDPLVVWAARSSPTRWVDIGDCWAEDATTCPSCSRLIAFNAAGFECPCGLESPKRPGAVLDGHSLVTPAGTYQLDLAMAGKWNLANAALALVSCEMLGANVEKSKDAISGLSEVNGRLHQWHLRDGRVARLLLAKNPAGWNQVLGFLATLDSGVVVAVNAQTADGTDPSWIWDVQFEQLRGRHVIASGERATDLAVRLRYAGLAAGVVPDPLHACWAVEGDRVDVAANYSAFQGLYSRIK